eukprot:scaffold814_cov100-Cylindrotheca_fusiformis.AAC.13
MVFSPILYCFIPQTSYSFPVSVKRGSNRIPQEPPLQRHQSSHSSRLYADIKTEADLELLPSIREAIQESEDDTAIAIWDECVDLVSTKSGLSPELSELALAKANGWKAWIKVTSKFAKKYMKTYIPDKAKLETALTWSLGSPLSLSSEQLSRAIRDYPEVYLSDPASNYEKALSVAPKQYQDPEKFISLALADPSVLGCTFNCVNLGCSSECGNCWVSYENRKSLQVDVFDA